MSKSIFKFLLIGILFLSCDKIKSGTKDAIDKTAEKAGKVGTDIVTKVGEGVEKSLQCAVVLSNPLKESGLQNGKLNFTSQRETIENVLSIYFMFDKDFSKTVFVKVIDEKGLEYGRTSLLVKGKKGAAGYYDFIFEKRVNLESKSTFIFE
jgi:hypothetical protein